LGKKDCYSLRRVEFWLLGRSQDKITLSLEPDWAYRLRILLQKSQFCGRRGRNPCWV